MPSGENAGQVENVFKYQRTGVQITGICTNRYRMMYAMENHSLVGLAVRTDELFCVLTPSHLHRKTVGA